MGVVRGVGDFASVGACAKADDVAGCTCWCAGRGSDVVCNCNYNDLQPSQQAFENMFEDQSGKRFHHRCPRSDHANILSSLTWLLFQTTSLSIVA